MTRAYDFDSQCRAWATPPVGGENLHPGMLLGHTDAMLVHWTTHRFAMHHNQDGADDMFRLMGVQTTQGKRVLDFGCGFGLDALSYGLAGNEVVLADIVDTNLLIASRIHKVFGLPDPTVLVAQNEPPWFGNCGTIDVFHANGVLHHTPHAREILERACEVLSADGEVRLMVYTDKLFKAATGLDPNLLVKQLDIGTEEWRVIQAQFVRFADAVGYWADWYDERKLRNLIDGLPLTLVSWDEIRKDKGYAIAILKRADLAG